MMNIPPQTQANIHSVAMYKSPWSYHWGTIRTLWKRDLVRFFRQRSRILGALVQPLIFWFVLGSGFSKSFRIEGAEQISYSQYFFPGVVLMTALFTSIFSTISVIEDRREGFMQAVLTAPGSRLALVIGKTLGGSSIAFVQALLILALAPIAGFSLSAIEWAPLLLMLIFCCIALTSIGLAIAWWLNSVQGYHAVMTVLLIPLWLMSGSMFPMSSGPTWLVWVARLNPLSYIASSVRHSLMPSFVDIHRSSFLVEIVVITITATLGLTLSTWVVKRNQ